MGEQTPATVGVQMKPMRFNPKKAEGQGGIYGGKKTKVFFRDTREYIRKAQVILETVGNLRLVGETGVGKSTIVEAMCDEFDWELHQYQLSTETSRMDLLAQDILVPDGKGATEMLPRLGVIAESMLEPKHPNRPQVLFLDEWNYAQPSVLTIMNSLTDARRNVRIPELAGMASRTGSGWDFKAGDPIVKRQPNHYIIIGMNPSEKTQYSGTNAMNIAQLRRFESLRIEYLKEGPELEVIQLTVPEADTLTFEKLIHFAAWSRTQYTKEELSVPITTGNLIAYAKLMRGGLDMSDIIEIIQAMFREDELESVKGSLMTLKLAKAEK